MSSFHQVPLQVSVILPVHLSSDAAEGIAYLEAAIESAIEQDYPEDWEILIIDDGSAVVIESVLSRKFISCHPTIRYFRSSNNLGLVHALNLGLAQARYGLIARLDADDSWVYGKIATQISRFTSNPELTIVGTGMRMHFDSGEPPQDIIRKDGWEDIIRFVIDIGCPFPHGSVVARRDIYLLLGGYSHSPTIRHAEDFELWTRWIRFFKPAMVEECLYNYRVTPLSVSNLSQQTQREASGFIHSNFLALDGLMHFPQLLADFASQIEMSLIDAGRIAYYLWKYRPGAWLLPHAAIDTLRRLLPDRRVIRAANHDKKPARNIFCLLGGDADPRLLTEAHSAFQRVEIF